MKSHIENSVNFAPDEPGSPGAAPKVPETVTIEGVGDVAFKDLVETYANRNKFEAANHERATEIKNIRAQQQAEIAQLRKEAQTDRDATRAERQQFLQTLERTVPQPAAEAPFDARSAIAAVDFLDPSAPQVLADVMSRAEEEHAARLERQEKTFEQRMARAESGFSKKLEETAQSITKKSERTSAKERAEKVNNEIFDSRMASAYPEVLKSISQAELNEVRELYQSQISNKYGGWQGGEWIFNKDAVDAAVRGAAPSHKILLAREVNAARESAIRTQLNGEDATESTPLRGRQRSPFTPDELNERGDQLNSALRNNRLTPLEVDASLPDDPAALRALIARRAAIVKANQS